MSNAIRYMLDSIDLLDFSAPLDRLPNVGMIDLSAINEPDMSPDGLGPEMTVMKASRSAVKMCAGYTVPIPKGQSP